MTVASETFWAGPFIANGVQTTFTFSFPIIEKADVIVLADGAEVAGNFVVEMNDPEDYRAGGSVVFDTPHQPATGVSVLLLRRRDYLQETSLPSQGVYSPRVIEAAFDALVMLVQQSVRRTVLFPEVALGDDFSGAIAGSLAGKAGYALTVNQTEDGVELSLGPPGTPGQDGNTVLSSAGAPDSGDGIDGDYCIDTGSFDIYGPKTSGAWGSGTSLVGPPGAGSVSGPASHSANTFARWNGTPNSQTLVERSASQFRGDLSVYSTTEVDSAIASGIATQDAMIFKGVVDCSANPNYPAADRGHTYRVSVAGKIGGGSGPNVEAGDILICGTDSTSSGNHATVGSNWYIAQANLDGAVIGPASATDGYLSQWDGTTGRLLKAGVSATKLAALNASSGVTGTITVSTSDPSGGSDGDIWLKYTP